MITSYCVQIRAAPVQIRNAIDSGVDIDELRAFLAVVDNGSFAAAARAARFARATLTRRIDELEARTGRALFDRSSARPTLTDAGKRLVGSARGVVAEVEALLQDVSKTSERRELTVVMQPGAPTHLVVESTEFVRRLVPGMSFVQRVANNPIDRIEGADFAWFAGVAPPDGPYTATQFRSVPLRLFASRAYLDREGTPSLEDVPSRRIVTWSAPGVDPRALPVRTGGVLSIQPTVIYEAAATLREHAATGACLGYGPAAAINPRFEPDEPLIDVLGEVIGAEVGMWLVVPEASGKWRSQLLPAVLGFMSRVFFDEQPARDE